MFRLFLPLYLLLFLFGLFQSDIADFALRQLHPAAEEADVLADLSGATFMVEEILVHRSRAEWPELLEKMSAPNIRVNTTNFEDPAITPEAAQILAAGDIWVAQIGEDLIYKKFTQSDDIMVIGPIYTVDVYDETMFLANAGSAAFLIVLVLVWAFALQRRITKLSEVAAAFGQDNFSLRADTSKAARVGSLNRSFNRMADRIERLIVSHKDLTNAVSHELRTPLSRIQFELEYAAGLSEVDTLQASLDSISEDTSELDKLIRELLLYARYDRASTELNLQEFNLSLWLTEWAAGQRLPASSTLELKIQTPGELHATFDPHAIDRALSNLVQNAQRFARHTIRLKAGSEQHQVFLLVDDDGSGIAPDLRETLLQPFYRPDSHRNKKHDGVGLGLAIVNQIAKRHGGTLTIEDSDLGGARFRLRWPDKPENN